MSTKEWAKQEMERANFDEGSKQTFSAILDMFFDEWDSGGAVHWAAPILQRLIAGQPLSPLTGEDDEWNEVGDGIFQNRRDSSVFKQMRLGVLEAYDIDTPGRPTITFPYFAERAAVPSPVIEIGS